MDLATCGLHVVHGSIKTGAKASESELKKLIKTMWKFVHDAPSRQGIFENISQSQIIQPNVVVAVGLKTKSVLKRQSR